MSEERREEIMRAVYAALCTQGYADLTMQDIADESTISKGTLHYHYDTKRELLLAFLDHLSERFTDRLAAAEADAGADPAERLLAVVEAAMFPPVQDDLREFRTAVLEIKAQAPFEPAFRDRLADFDDYLAERVESIVADGVAAGRFADDTDPARVADFVVTVINGAHTRSVATDHAVAETHRAVVEYVEGRLATDDGPVEADGRT